MAHFQYRLQPLLDLKLEYRKALERALAALRLELAAEEAALVELRKTHDALKVRFAEALRARLSADSIVQSRNLDQHTHYLRGLAADLEAAAGAAAAQRIRIAGFQDRVTAALRQLAQAAHEVEVLNKHRERLERGFLRMEERKEALEQDEMGSIVFNRGRRHEGSQ